MSARGQAAPHLPELDGVRGFAILMVMALHFVCTQITAPQSRLEAVVGRLTGYGDWGVDLFFVLSGFLITGILYDTRGNERYFKTFYARRTLRIFPLYYGTLLVLILLPRALLEHYAPQALVTRDLEGWLWPYLTNVYLGMRREFDLPYLSHFWTLAIEEHFYLVWPFVVGFLSRESAMRVCVVASVASLALRATIAHLYPTLLAHLVLTPCRLDALCIGAWLALAIRGPLGIDGFVGKAKRGCAVAAAGVVLVSLWHATHPGDAASDALRRTMLALFFGTVILLGSWNAGPALLKQSLRVRWLRFLGKYSYGLYVFHGIIAYMFVAHRTLPIFERLVGGHFSGLLFQAAVGTAVSLVLAVASYELFEVRFLRLKRLYEPKRAG